MSEYHQPHETAQSLGITPATLRRWADYHKAYLSPETQPSSGQPRRFTNRDIEILKHCKHLRDQGLTVASINEQLAGLTFPEIEQPDTTIDLVETATDLPTAQEAHHATPAPLVPLDDLGTLFEAWERSRLKEDRVVRHGLIMFGAGFIAALLFVLVIVLLASLYGGFR